MPQRGSGGGMGFVAILIALVFIVAPIALPFVTGLSQVILVGFGCLLLVVGGIVVTISRLYVKTSSDEAFVRTGMGGLTAVIDGGALVIPTIHNVVPVTLESIKLTVDRKGINALITGDKLRADVTAEFFIKVAKIKEDILAAATSLGSRLSNPLEVEKLVFEKLVSALRTVAATKTLAELNEKRDEFKSAVQEIVTHDLKPNGLTLESVTISHLDQTSPKDMKPEENVFDAEGALTIATTVQKRRVERNAIERQADQDVKEQDVTRDQFVYLQEVTRATAEAEKGANIQKAQATAKQDAETFTAQQEQLIGVAKAESERGVQVAEVEKAKTVQVANQAREQAAEVAERERQIAVAEAEKRRAAATAERNEAEAKAEAAKQKVVTVEITAEAERNKVKTVIGAQAVAETRRVNEQVAADITAYTQVKVAEGALEAADKEAEARIKRATADKTAKTLEAEGDTAVQMVPVNVAGEQVDVDARRINEVVKTELEVKKANQEVAVALQIELAKIEAEKEVRIALANAMGTALGNSKMTIWGDPKTAATMMASFTNGQAVGALFQGVETTLPDGVKSGIGDMLSGFGRVGSRVIENLTGAKVTPAAVEKAVRETVGVDAATR